YQRRNARTGGPLPGDAPAREDLALVPSDEAFLAAWRAQLVARAWEGLAEFERRTGQPPFAVLRLRADAPGLTGAELAERVSAALGRQIDAGWVRKRLHFAREKFAEFLVGEVIQTLDRPDPSVLADELIVLGLYEHCRTVIGPDPATR